MKSINLYIVVQDHGIYEVLELGEKTQIVVQTNIRTREKAIEARKIWQARELAKHE